MSSNTPNLGLLKKDPMVDGNETFNIETMLNDNWDKIDEAVGRTGGYGETTQASANAYEVQVSPAPVSLAAGMRVTIKVNAASTGSPTLNVNGLGDKPVLKPSGNAASLKENGVYTLVFDGQAFILQGEGGEVGTATAPDVLAGKTFPGEDGLIAGTMADRSNTGSSGEYTTADVGVIPHPEGGDYLGIITKPRESGFYNKDNSYINTWVLGLTAEKIQAGVKAGPLGGKQITGTFTSDGSVTASEILSGRVAFSKGSRIVGTMVNRSRASLGEGYVQAVSTRGDSSGSLVIEPQTGYYTTGKNANGFGSIITNDPDYVSGNIRAGVDIFGVVGTMQEGKKYHVVNIGSLTTTWSDYSTKKITEIRGVPFRPKSIIFTWDRYSDSSKEVSVSTFDPLLTNAFVPSETNPGGSYKYIGVQASSNVYSDGFDVFIKGISTSSPTTYGNVVCLILN